MDHHDLPVPSTGFYHKDLLRKSGYRLEIPDKQTLLARDPELVNRIVTFSHDLRSPFTAIIGGTQLIAQNDLKGREGVNLNEERERRIQLNLRLEEIKTQVNDLMDPESEFMLGILTHDEKLSNTDLRKRLNIQTLLHRWFHTDAVGDKRIDELIDLKREHLTGWFARMFHKNVLAFQNEFEGLDEGLMDESDKKEKSLQ